MSVRTVVEHFYDVISPYSWLGFEVLCRYRNVWNVELKLHPAFLGGVMHGSGNRRPPKVQNKDLYQVKDILRTAKYFNLPLRHPSNLKAIFEKGSLPAMRFITAVEEREQNQDLVEKVSRELWNRIWSRDEDICDPASLSEVGLKVGFSSNQLSELLELSKSQPIKDKLKQRTQEALDYKSFGFPFTVCHVNGKPEIFFGSDRFEIMAHCIGEKWLGPDPQNPTCKL